jgi:hypothetical protein
MLASSNNYRRTYTTLDEAISASDEAIVAFDAMLGHWQCMIMIVHCDYDRGLGYEEEKTGT